MNAGRRVSEVRFEDARLIVDLADGRAIAVPVAWYPRLERARAAERAEVSISASGLHWEELDEDIDRGAARGAGRYDPGADRGGMSADERVLEVRFEDERLIVDLADGWTIAVPAAWPPPPRERDSGRAHQSGNRGGPL